VSHPGLWRSSQNPTEERGLEDDGREDRRTCHRLGSEEKGGTKGAEKTATPNLSEKKSKEALVSEGKEGKGRRTPRVHLRSAEGMGQRRRKT